MALAGVCLKTAVGTRNCDLDIAAQVACSQPVRVSPVVSGTNLVR
jgi:hypothetical protein